MANLLRNEVEIDIGGKKRTMRADFTAISAIEGQTGMSMIALTARGDIPVTAMAHIVHAGLKSAGDESMSVDEIGNAILEKGYSNPLVIGPVMKFLTGALSGFSMGKSAEAPAGQ